jgi:hypothetical protein
MKAEWCNNAHGLWNKSRFNQRSLFEPRCCIRRSSRIFSLTTISFLTQPSLKCSNESSICNDAHGRLLPTITTFNLSSFFEEGGRFSGLDEGLSHKNWIFC